MSVRHSLAHPIPDDLPTVRAQYGIAQRYHHGGGRFRHNVDGTIEDEAEPINVFSGIQPPAHWQAVLAEVQTRRSRTL